MTLEEAVAQFENGRPVRRNAFQVDLAHTLLFRVSSRGWQTHEDFARNMNGEPDDKLVLFLTEDAAIRAWLENLRACSEGQPLSINWWHAPRLDSYKEIYVKMYGEPVAIGKFYSVHSTLYFS